MTTSNETKIRIGGIDYTLPFLQSLLDTVRDEYPSFSSDMLRMWENNEHKQRRETESNADIADREAEQRAIERQIELEKIQEYKSE